MENEQQQALLEQLEERFRHADLNHPALRRLHDIQASALQQDKQE